MPFGEELANDPNYRTAALKYNTGDGVRQKFTGYQKDEETNLDFAEARMYENRHARFTAVDPLLASGKSVDPQTFNRYVYCLNNPLVFTDPTGLQSGAWIYDNNAPEGRIRPTYINRPLAEGERPWDQGMTYETFDGDTVTLDPYGPMSVEGAGQYYGYSLNGVTQGTGVYNQSNDSSGGGGPMFLFFRFRPPARSLMPRGWNSPIIRPPNFRTPHRYISIPRSWTRGGQNVMFNPNNPYAGTPQGVYGPIVPGTNALQSRINPTGSRDNCVNCVLSLDSTLAGRPTSALPRGSNYERNFFNQYSLTNTFGTTWTTGTRKQITNELLNAGPGARGIIWGIRTNGSGHVFNGINVNNNVIFLDGQVGRPASWSGFKSFRFLFTHIPD